MSAPSSRPKALFCCMLREAGRRGNSTWLAWPWANEILVAGCRNNVLSWRSKIMKTVIVSITAALAAVGFIAAVGAQSFSIDWYTVDGGGGTSSGGNYSVTGTIGQPDAGATMSGGNYTVAGGFWSYAAAIQTPGAPFLTVLQTGTN